MSGSAGTAMRLVDVVRNAVAAKEVTAGSKAIIAMAQQLCRFQAAALAPGDQTQPV